MSKVKRVSTFAMARKGARKRTFSLSHMSKVKRVSTLPWREKVHESEHINPYWVVANTGLRIESMIGKSCLL